MTAASQRDVSLPLVLLTSKETMVYGDSGYLGAEKQEDVKKNKSANC